MFGLRTEVVPPSGVEYATFLKLTTAEQLSKNVLGNLVVARSSCLRIFEVREEPAPLPTLEQVEQDTKGEFFRRGTEAVEGEVAMDEQGEGFVNMASVKTLPPGMHVAPSTVTKLFLVREHLLHGIVTGLDRVQTTSTADDGLDRLLISFRDAKMSLMEWSPYLHDLTTVSLHTYERSQQILNLPPPSSAGATPVTNSWRAKLRVDPSSRCSLLTLPRDSLALLPFQSQAELDMMDDLDRELGRRDTVAGGRDVPYQPSFILDLPADIDTKIRNIIDVIFIPGFNNPTIAVAFQERQTWTGRLNEFKDTTSIYIITLDLITRSYPIITQIENLPYDILYLVPCLPSATYGGVLAVTSNALIHVDQAGKTAGIALNGWANRVSALQLPIATNPGSSIPLDLALEGSKVYFADPATIVAILADGDVRSIRLHIDGRAISKFEIGGVMAKTTIPSSLVSLTADFLFVGSVAGDSVLLKTTFEEVTIEKEIKATIEEDDPDMELDEDIYGDLKTTEPNAPAGPQTETVRVLNLAMADTLPAHGTISDMCFALTQPGNLDAAIPELVACTGVGHLGGLTRFTKHIPTRTKRTLPTVGGTDGIWSFPVKKRSRNRSAGGGSAGPRDASEGEWIMVSTNDGHGQGITRIITRSTRSTSGTFKAPPTGPANAGTGGSGSSRLVTENRDIRISSKPGVTVSAGAFFQNTSFVTVGRDGTVRLFDGDLAERQAIPGSTSAPKVTLASVSDPYVAFVKEDHSVEVFAGDTMENKLGKIESSSLLPKSTFAMIFHDRTGLFKYDSSASGGDDDHMKTERLEDILDSERGTQWLVLFTATGKLEIRSLPKLELAFTSKELPNLPQVFTCTSLSDEGADDMDEDSSRSSNSQFGIDTLTIASLGEAAKKPYLLILTHMKLLVLYEITPFLAQSPQSHVSGDNHLPIQMVKISTRILEPQPRTSTTSSQLTSPPTHFTPFAATYGLRNTYISGVFCSGASPFWIIATDKGGPRVHPANLGSVAAFTPCGDMFVDGAGSRIGTVGLGRVNTVGSGDGMGRVEDFVVCTDEGSALFQWMGDTELGSELPYRSVVVGRQYTSILFDPPTGHIVAVSSQKAPFRLFDDEGNPTWSPDAPGISDPQCECSAVELISPDTWTTVDGYEFVQNEFVNTAKSVSLETLSTERGQKGYVVVGTTIFRGEDLAVKGAVYVFEVVEVVPDPNSPKRRHKLRLLCRDEAKGPVTAVCGINGYLVSSMGQKVFVRAFEMDERLVGVAFLDVGLYVTSLTTLKNLLLIGDAMKSVWFVCFQEEPFKLIVLSKDQQTICVSNANFFFGEGKDLSFVTSNEDGIIRMYDYNPMDPDSNNGQHLICQTEFDAHADHLAVLTTARRPEPSTFDESADDGDVQMALAQAQSVLVFGSLEGAISIISPISQDAFRRLSLLQGQLIRNVQHLAGLNPKGFRIVHNDKFSRPLSKGILDGVLLGAFKLAEVGRQQEMTSQIGTDRTTVLRDLIALSTTW